MKECLSCQNRCPDCTHCFKKLHSEVADARELAAMYLQCLNSRALERGEEPEKIADFCNREFAENPWLKEEYQKLVEAEAQLKRDVDLIKRFR